MSRPAVCWIACRYSARSAWARGPRTAGPLLRFSSLKWMPAASAARPISPSSASTSRTRCPLPIPPIDGLQDISPIVFRRWVSNSVRAPMRAAAAAASHPACPPPTTTTSKRSTTRSHLVTCAPGALYSAYGILLSSPSHPASARIWQCGAGRCRRVGEPRPSAAGRDPADRGRRVCGNDASAEHRIRHSVRRAGRDCRANLPAMRSAGVSASACCGDMGAISA